MTVLSPARHRIPRRLAVAVVACTFNRLPGIWRQAFRPPRRVPDDLFERDTAVIMTSDATPAGISSDTVRLAEGERIQLGCYEYEVVGRRSFAGISVRKDRGDTFIWVGSGLLLFGIVITLWLPRQRAWDRFRGNEARMVSQGRGQLDPPALPDNDS